MAKIDYFLFSSSKYKPHHTYWHTRISDIEEPFAWGSSKISTAKKTFKRKSKKFTIDKKLTARIGEIANDNDFRIFTTLLASFQVLLLKMLQLCL